MAYTLYLLLQASFVIASSSQIPMVLPPAITLGRASAAIAALQGFYNRTTGLWDTTGWWNSGNCLTVIADYASLDPSFAANATDIFENTYEQAQNFSVPISQLISPARHFKLTSYTTSTLPPRNPTRRDEHESLVDLPYTASSSPGFINDFYDDEGWWALAWIRAYDASNRTKPKYLAIAETIFEDMTYGWNNGTTNETSCQGLWWNKQHAAINAIENELFLSVAAHLANRVPNLKNHYLNWALKEWSWFQGTEMITPYYSINDGINLTTCQNNGEPVWTYNQGVILGGLVELNYAAPSASYLVTANAIANAAIDFFGNTDGIIVEACDPNCGADGDQFKGIFMRNLYYLWEVTQQPRFLETIQKNAERIWDFDRNELNRFGPAWSGPVERATAGTHSSASDVIVGAAKIDTANEPSNAIVKQPKNSEPLPP